jgi:hypothetical protein
VKTFICAALKPMNTKHTLLEEMKLLTKKLGRTPTTTDIQKEYPEDSHLKLRSLRENFGSLENLSREIHNPLRVIQEAEAEVQEKRMLRKYNSLCAKKEQIQGFFRHTLDLDEMFKRAGNPKSLKVIAQPDTHAKFVHRPSFNAFLKFMKYYAPDVLIIMGDFADCEGLAHWEPNSLEPRRIVPEMKIARDLLKQEVEATETCTTRIFLEGNHEYWIQMALTRMPELFEGLEDLGFEINVKTLLALDKFGFDFFPLNHLIKIGKAHFTHGLYTTMHHAKKHLDTFKGNIYYGHLHDVQMHNQTSLDGHMETASLGCLCRLDAQFLKGRPNNWVNAFGIFEFLPNGSYTFIRPSIIEGVFSYNGTLFDGNEDTKSN